MSKTRDFQCGYCSGKGLIGTARCDHCLGYGLLAEGDSQYCQTHKVTHLAKSSGCPFCKGKKNEEARTSRETAKKTTKK